MSYGLKSYPCYQSYRNKNYTTVSIKHNMICSIPNYTKVAFVVIKQNLTPFSLWFDQGSYVLDPHHTPI